MATVAMDISDEARWRESVRQQMESELNRRVREALEPPPLETAEEHNPQDGHRESPDINAHLFLGRSDRRFHRARRWGPEQGFNMAIGQGNMVQAVVDQSGEIYNSKAELRMSHLSNDRWTEGVTGVQGCYSRFPDFQPKVRQFYTNNGYVTSLRSGDCPVGVEMVQNRELCVGRGMPGPFWPADYLPLFATPRFKWWIHATCEPLETWRSSKSKTTESQVTLFKGQWRGVQVVYDSDRSPRDVNPLQVPEGCCPTLMFESRFECGNLRQARRVGQFEYELLLKSDLYTTRHTQWYYFRVTNIVPGVTYKFRIINLLKRDSLYNQGMRPLVYSEMDARVKQRGWVRDGHHISYSRTCFSHNCSLLEKGVTYHTLEWQMTFTNANDTYYLAHCYPYSFTDLKEDLELMVNDADRSKVTKREVMCETLAGNCCFLLTITNFDCLQEKKAVVVTARVHPGESQASWMMKGFLEFITGPDSAAQKLRDKFVFKVVPMINPDGVIVGNYRCSLAARDLNRNYRHPRQESFPTIWYIKNLVNHLAKTYEIALYCDLHGHSRKPNVFMYGNNPSSDLGECSQSVGRAVISDRLFPWIMSVKSPDKFHFQSCKFKIRRCKESTGRVVMWRQMRVLCSFTMEASFSGTVLDRENYRHFNIRDFMEMGRSLAEAVLEYQAVKDDPVRHAQTVLGLTRVITEQVLISRGLLKPGMTLPVAPSDFSHKPEGPSTEVAMSNQEPCVPDGNRSDGTTNTCSPSVHPCGDVDLILQRLSAGCSMEDCVDLLERLDVHMSLEESDSSDSDSESEPETKSAELKARKKRRQSRKQRDKDKHISKKTLNTEEKIQPESSRARSATLPSLGATPRHKGSNSAPTYADSSTLWPPKQQMKAQTTSEKFRPAEKCGLARQAPSFVSKYEGRHNGGLPCFTEERSMERAAQRIAVLRRKQENSSTTTEDSVCLAGDGLAASQDGPSQGLNDDSEEDGEPSNVRTSYTHADSLEEAYPGSIHALNGLISQRKMELSPQVDHPDTGPQDLSLPNHDDHVAVQPFPLTARKSPYGQPDQTYPSRDLAPDRPSYFASERRRSVATTTAGAQTPATIPSSSASVSAAFPRLHPSPTLAGKSNCHDVKISLMVNSLSTAAAKLTPLTTASVSMAELAKTLQELQHNHKSRPKNIKMEPIGLSRSLMDKQSNIRQVINTDDLVIVNNRVLSKLEDVASDAPTENGCQRNTLSDIVKSDNGLNVRQLVNRLSHNVSGVASSSLQTPQRRTSFRNNQAISDKTRNHMASSPLLTTTSLAPLKEAALTNNFIPKRTG